MYISVLSLSLHYNFCFCIYFLAFIRTFIAIGQIRIFNKFYRCEVQLKPSSNITYAKCSSEHTSNSSHQSSFFIFNIHCESEYRQQYRILHSQYLANESFSLHGISTITIFHTTWIVQCCFWLCVYFLCISVTVLMYTYFPSSFSSLFLFDFYSWI